MKEKSLKEKAANFWKENKKTILNVGAGAGLFVLGGALVRQWYSYERNVVKMLSTFDNNFIEDLIEAQAGSTSAPIYFGTPGKSTIANAVEAIQDYYVKNGVSLDTEATGMVIFTKAKDV